YRRRTHRSDPAVVASSNGPSPGDYLHLHCPRQLSRRRRRCNRADRGYPIIQSDRCSADHRVRRCCLRLSRHQLDDRTSRRAHRTQGESDKMNQTTTIFEPGGPRQRRLVRIATIGSAIILLALAYVVIEQLHYEGQLISQKWLTVNHPHYVGFLLKGFSVTLKVSAASVVLSRLLGIVLAVARLSPSKWASVPATVFVEFFRGMPFLLIIFVVMFGLPPLGITMPPYWQLVLSIVLVAGSMFAEVFRAGILDIRSEERRVGRECMSM